MSAPPRPNLVGLSLRDLQYAVAVADTCHFKRAADQCGVSQPALSEQLRKLESLLGTPLFERSSRRVAVTDQGQALIRQARKVLQDAFGLLEMARAYGDPLRGPMRVGVIPTLGPYYIPLVLRLLRQSFPGLELRLQEGLTEELAQALRGGTLDAMLVALPVATDGFSVAPLFFEPFRLLAPAAHPLPGAGPVKLDALPSSDMLLLEVGHCLREQAMSLCHLPGHAAQGVRQASSLEMLRHMVAAGEGFALMPALAAGGMHDTHGLGTLTQIRPLADTADGLPVGRDVALAWRVTDPRHPHFRALAGFLADQAPDGTTRPINATVGAPSGFGHRSAATPG